MVYQLNGTINMQKTWHRNYILCLAKHIKEDNLPASMCEALIVELAKRE